MTTIITADDFSVNSANLKSSDAQAILEALVYFGEAIDMIISMRYKLDPEVAKDKDFALKAIAITGDIYKHLDPSIQADLSVVTAVLEKDGGNLYHIPAEFRGNKELALKAFNSPGKYSGYRLDCVSKELQDDKEVVLAAISKRDMGTALQHASGRLKDDKEVVLIALKNSVMPIGSSLKRDTLSFASERLRDDEEVVARAILSNYELFKFASERLRSDREFVKHMMDERPLAFFCSNDEFKKDPELNLLYLEKSSSGSWTFPENLLNDKEWMLKAVQFAPNAALALKQWHDRLTLTPEDMFEIIEQSLINGRRFAEDPAHYCGRGSQIGHFLPHMKGCHEFKNYPDIVRLLNQY